MMLPPVLCVLFVCGCLLIACGLVWGADAMPCEHCGKRGHTHKYRREELGTGTVRQGESPWRELCRACYEELKRK